MISGSEALGSIDDAVRRAQAEAAAIDRDVAGLNERRLRLHEEEGQACRELALFRLRQVTGEGMISTLSEAEDRARALLKRRAEAIATLDARIAETEAETARLEQNHKALLGDAEARRGEYTSLAEAVLARLAETQSYREQARRADTAERVARHAEEKTRRALDDRRIKGKPYEEDPLFMYLWKRGYGSAEYRGDLISRFFDRRIARLIGFDGARANYAMLLEIPRRLQAHAERWRAAADAEARSLDEMEETALGDSEAAGPSARLAEAEKAVAEAEEQLQEAEERAEDLAGQRAELASGEDAETRAAITEIADRLQDADIRRLRESARLTPLPDDDHIVERIAALESEIAGTDRELRKTRQRQAEQRRKLKELETIRREYRNRGYGAASWDFGDAQVLSVLLAQLVAGALSRDGFWGHMNRRRLPWPCSPGWCGPRRSRMPAEWGRGMPRMPRPSRRSRGGFRTTGSF